MRVVIQRVKQARLFIAGQLQAEIKAGLLVLAGIHRDDQVNDAIFLADKILNLRVFADQNHKMNLSLKDVKGEMLIVSQFTLYANTANGNRPDFTQAAPPPEAEKLYDKLVRRLQASNLKVATGSFGADMLVELANDGPVTIIMDSR